MRKAEPIILFMCGELLMTGRGIDQVLPNPGNPIIYEPFVKNAKEYVGLAEAAAGSIPNPVGSSYNIPFI